MSCHTLGDPAADSITIALVNGDTISKCRPTDAAQLQSGLVTQGSRSRF